MFNLLKIRLKRRNEAFEERTTVQNLDGRKRRYESYKTIDQIANVQQPWSFRITDDGIEVSRVTIPRRVQRTG